MCLFFNSKCCTFTGTCRRTCSLEYLSARALLVASAFESSDHDSDDCLQVAGLEHPVSQHQRRRRRHVGHRHGAGCHRALTQRRQVRGAGRHRALTQR